MEWLADVRVQHQRGLRGHPICVPVSTQERLWHHPYLRAQVSVHLRPSISPLSCLLSSLTCIWFPYAITIIDVGVLRNHCFQQFFECGRCILWCDMRSGLHQDSHHSCLSFATEVRAMPCHAMNLLAVVRSFVWKSSHYCQTTPVRFQRHLSVACTLAFMLDELLSYTIVNKCFKVDQNELHNTFDLLSFVIKQGTAWHRSTITSPT